MSERPPFSAPLRTTAFAAGVILFATVAAYLNTLSAPFIFDDVPAILNNPTIRHMAEAVTPPHDGSGASGRPMVNLSLALNYALGGTDPFGYHLFNLAVHALASLVLFGLVRRTLLLPLLRQRFGAAATPLALVVAVIWAVHPLQTESVTCVVQRTESLMGLFYLLTLYGFVRGSTGHLFDASSPRTEKWNVLAVFACLVGMATKEVMVSAPLMALVYDRTFVAGSFREAWRQRRRVYVGLAATWLLLAWLVAGGGGGRATAAGFGLGITGWTYALTQCKALVHYLRLVIWPHPLVLDYGLKVVTAPSAVAPQAVLLIGLVAATAWALARRPLWGLAGAWFFMILAPSSSVVPLVTQTIAEHRMYLPLAMPVTLIVLGAYAWMGRRAFPVLAMVALGLGWMTVLRNDTYRSAISIWSDTVEHCPENARAHALYAGVLLEAGRAEDAAVQYLEAVRLAPAYAPAQNNLGNLLVQLGRVAEAQEHFAAAVRAYPEFAEAHNNLGSALNQQGRLPAAIDEFNQALRLKPGYAEAHANLANALLAAGRGEEAVNHYEQALQLRPDFPGVRSALGWALFRLGRVQEAAAQFQQLVQRQPADPDAHNSFGFALARLGHLPEAEAEFAEALRLKPDYTPAQENLARVRVQRAATH